MSGSVQTTTPRVAVVSMQRLPQHPETWARLHVDLGVDGFYLRLEDSPGLASRLRAYFASVLQPAHPTRTLVLRIQDAGSVDHSHGTYHTVITRQEAWINTALELAAQDGMQWLFHIDDDEVLVPAPTALSTSAAAAAAALDPGTVAPSMTWPDVLRTVPSSCASVHLHNWEAFSPSSPASSWLTDPGVRVLPRTCAHLYSAYGNGKSGARVGSSFSVQAHGPHHFLGGKECALPEGRGVVTHYEALATGPQDLPAQRWVDKNKLRLHDDMAAIPFASVKDGVAAVASADPQAMLDTWTKYRSVDGARFKACPAPLALVLPSHKY